MTLADKITFLRIILSPVFFIVFFLPSFYPAWFSGGSGWTVPVLWVIFLVCGLSDMFDGMVARLRNESSDFGRLFDPFADTIMQITFFLCYVLDGIFPAALLLLIIYREFGILFMRNLMLRKGIAMGARMGGKIKTVTYIIAGSTALLTVSLKRLALFNFLHPFVRMAAIVLFLISVVFSIISFLDYLSVYRKSN